MPSRDSHLRSAFVRSAFVIAFSEPMLPWGSLTSEPFRLRFKLPFRQRQRQTPKLRHSATQQDLTLDQASHGCGCYRDGSAARLRRSEGHRCIDEERVSTKLAVVDSVIAICRLLSFGPDSIVCHPQLSNPHPLTVHCAVSCRRVALLLPLQLSYKASCGSSPSLRSASLTAASRSASRT